jgi:hypothetical protein
VHGCHALATRRPFGHFIEQAVYSEVIKVGADLGSFWANLDLRPETKFDLHGLLYISY